MLLFAQALQAQGILFVEQETRNGKTTTNQVQLDKTHMRAESHSSGDDVAFVYDAGAQVVRSINLDKKTYMEIDRSQIQQMQQQAQRGLSQIDEQLKNLSPQQRAIVEQAMRGRGGVIGATAAPPAKTEYRQAGMDKVGQWTCTKYEGFRGQDKVAEVCTVDPKEFGVTPADFDVARQLADFLKSMSPQMSDQTIVYGTAADQGYSGVPVRRTTYTGGKVASVSEIKEVRHENFPASTFEVPAGFRKENPGGRD
jgi:hypothetical protein